MKRILATLSIAALAGIGVVACDAPERTCAPSAASSYGIALQDVQFPLAPGGSSGGGSGRGGSSGGGSYGGSKSSSGSSRSGGSSSSKNGGSSFGGGSAPRTPSSRPPDRSYHPAPGQPAYVYVQQSDGHWGQFLNGMLVGQMLNDPPAGCR